MQLPPLVQKGYEEQEPLKPVFHGKASAKQLVKSHGLCISKGYSLAQYMWFMQEEFDCTF